MDRNVLDFLMRKVREDGRRGRDGARRDYEDGRDMRMRDERDYRDSRDYRDDRDYRDFRDYGDYRDRRDYGTWHASGDYADGRDYHHKQPLKLSKADMRKWEGMMSNTDGTRGKHYDMSQIIKAAEEIGVQFDDYDEKEFCLAVNMMYSDYGHIMKKHSSPQEKLICCAEMAKAFLEDPDGPGPSEKLALYFHCIADHE